MSDRSHKKRRSHRKRHSHREPGIGKRWWRYRKPLLILLALGLIGAVVYKPAWRGFRNWRSASLLKQSREFAQKGEWEESQRTAIASLQIDDDAVEGFRLAFEALRETKDVRTLHFGVALFGHPLATKADRVRVLEVVLDSNDLITTAELLSTLEESIRDEPDLVYQRLRLHLAMGEWSKAVELADTMSGTDRAAEFDLLLARGLRRAGPGEFQVELVTRLKNVLRDPAQPHAGRALVQLAGLPAAWLTDELAGVTVKRFEGRDALPVEEDLALATLRLRHAPASRQALVDSMITRHRQHLRELSAWLARVGEWEQVVHLTDNAVIDSVIFGHRITALHRLGRNEILQEELANPRVSIPAPVVLAARASLAERDNKPAEAVRLWQRAFELAEHDLTQNLFYRLSNIAKMAGSREREMEALAMAVEHPLGVPPSAEELRTLFAWLYLRNKGDRLFSITNRLLQREPRNPVLINNYHYFRALNDQTAEDAVADLKVLVDAFPDRTGYRSTLAFVLVRQAKPEEAIVILDELADNPADLELAEKAIYCAALSALGRVTEARRLERDIDWEIFPDRDAEVLRGLIGQEAVVR